MRAAAAVVIECHTRIPDDVAESAATRARPAEKNVSPQLKRSVSFNAFDEAKKRRHQRCRE